MSIHACTRSAFDQNGKRLKINIIIRLSGNQIHNHRPLFHCDLKYNNKYNEIYCVFSNNFVPLMVYIARATVPLTRRSQDMLKSLL